MVRVEEKGTFQNAPGLKEFTKAMLERGIRAFQIDLGGCPSMDSTFMGTLTGIALRLRECGGGSLRVVNITERNLDSLRNLGLDALFEISSENPETMPVAPMQVQVDKEETTEIMLEAHQALVEAAPENITRFKDVLDFLRNDLKDSSSS